MALTFKKTIQTIIISSKREMEMSEIIYMVIISCLFLLALFEHLRFSVFYKDVQGLIESQNELVRAHNKLNESKDRLIEQLKCAIDNNRQSLLKPPDIGRCDPMYWNKDGTANRSSVIIDDSGQHLPKTGSY